MLIEYEVMKQTIKDILLSKGVNERKAELSARILTDNTCDGIASHGINRFDRIIEYIDKGYINIEAEPEIINSMGALEVIDGHLGLGMTNASFAMDRAIMRSREFGIGCIAMRNNNHWMRGATYGLQAAKVGLIGICFTNTLPNMPAWGAEDSRIGNNPLVIAVPNGETPVVLDMAMSQFSYGKLETTVLNEDELPLFGGYNEAGQLTKNPQEILDSGRILPTGFWKGSGLSIVLDLMATILSGGQSTLDIGKQPAEYGISQVFIAIDPSRVNNPDYIRKSIEETLMCIKASRTSDLDHKVSYPGEGSARRRKTNRENGIPVNDVIWHNIESYI